MKFNYLEVKCGFLPLNRFEFTQNANIIHSTKNGVGKTTLLRLLMYSLGYSIPNTRGINFKDYETVIEVVSANSTIMTIIRNGNSIELIEENKSFYYFLPMDSNEILKKIFAISNDEVIDNLLGAFYVDQEKGWTLLNRGTVIGEIRFNLEMLIRGLSNRTNDELSSRLVVVKRELNQYKHMLNLDEYKAEINKLGKISFIELTHDEIDTELEVLYCKRKPLADEFDRIKSVIKKNSEFEKYISSFKLRVRTPNGDEIPVNKDTIVDFVDTVDLLDAKNRIIALQLASIDKNINALKSQQQKQTTLFNIQNSLQLFNTDISRINIDTIAIKKIITTLNSEKQKLEESLVKSIKRDNPIITDLHTLISSYAQELGLDEKYVRSNTDYIFTKDLKSLSGAIFHKVVFAFKISYISIIRKYTNICLPIILDSPNGREVTAGNVAGMINILARDFADHQILIASILNNYDVFQQKNIIEIKDRLLTSHNNMVSL
jgi:hypothetical protein